MNLPWLQPCLKPSVWEFDSMKMINKSCRQAIIQIVIRKSQAGSYGLPVWSGSRWGSTGRQERSERHGNLLTVFDPCGRVQPETDLFEPWRLDGSRLTLMPWQGKAQRDKDEEKEGIWGKSRGGGKTEYNWITGQKVVEKSTARELIGKDRAEVW